MLNRGLSAITRATRPRTLVRRAIAAWTWLDDIELADFEPGPFASLDDFFLRRIRPGARPLGPGFVSPADGQLLARGVIALDRPLAVKGQRLSVERIVNAGVHDLKLSGYEGGSYAVVFLTPRGYHRVHAPIDAELIDARWIPGRYFPQNEAALEHIPRVYERNERVVLRLCAQDGRHFLLVLVGASLIGGIHVSGVERARLERSGVVRLGRAVCKGEEIAHFAFGSTVIVLRPRTWQQTEADAGAGVLMGQTLWT